jgi:hypothetical protein
MIVKRREMHTGQHQYQVVKSTKELGLETDEFGRKDNDFPIGLGCSQ